MCSRTTRDERGRWRGPGFATPTARGAGVRRHARRTGPAGARRCPRAVIRSSQWLRRRCRCVAIAGDKANAGVPARASGWLRGSWGCHRAAHERLRRRPRCSPRACAASSNCVSRDEAIERGFRVTGARVEADSPPHGILRALRIDPAGRQTPTDDLDQQRIDGVGQGGVGLGGSSSTAGRHPSGRRETSSPRGRPGGARRRRCQHAGDGPGLRGDLLLPARCAAAGDARARAGLRTPRRPAARRWRPGRRRTSGRGGDRIDGGRDCPSGRRHRRRPALRVSRDRVDDRHAVGARVHCDQGPGLRSSSIRGASPRMTARNSPRVRDEPRERQVGGATGATTAVARGGCGAARRSASAWARGGGGRRPPRSALADWPDPSSTLRGAGEELREPGWCPGGGRR